ncbi:DNA-directed RNA polymerase III complex subunit Rpc25 [Microbotryomycetes sp. JL201]|nr:DNA-directed RNA polymerase III complex subunit Rpc25 [Microbotryomycetes sp. JL201]
MFTFCIQRDTIRVEAREFGKPPGEAIRQEIERRYANKVIPNVGLCVALMDILDATEGAVLYGDGCLYYKCEFRLIMFRPFVGELIIAKVRSQNEQGIRLSIGFFDDILVPTSLLPEWSAFNPAKRAFFWIPEDPENPRPQPPTDAQLLSESDDNKLYIERHDHVRIRVAEEVWQDASPIGTKPPPAVGTGAAADQSAAITKSVGTGGGAGVQAGQGQAGAVGTAGQANGTSKSSESLAKAPYQLLCSMGEQGTGVIEWWAEEA